VHTIEIVAPLAARARETLLALGYDRVTVHEGDGYAGLPALAPFDAIIVTAAPPTVPEALVEQLAVNGRLVVPVGRQDANQTLLLITKDEDGNIRERRDIKVRFVPMIRED
jgi:protein-L-isoaspartate(D-aspartate) O-methyltransferase